MLVEHVLPGLPGLVSREIRSLLDAAHDLLFPPSCLGCDAPLVRHRVPLFCSSCLSRLVPIVSPLCPRCGLPHVASAGDHLCGTCLRTDPPFDRVRSAYYYEGPLRPLIRQWKFSGNQNVLSTLAALSGKSTALSSLGDPTLVLPVPLHLSRLRSRGFNQSLQLARQGLPYSWRKNIDPDLLIRTRATVPQASLSGRQRRRNLRGAFSLDHTDRVAGASILLVDDVLTTGSTVLECCRVLRMAGARRIEVFTLARVV